MTTGERVAQQYRAWATEDLMRAPSMIRNERRRAAVQIVLTEREAARQRGRDTANTALTLVGGGDIGSWIPRARAAQARAQAAGDHETAEQANGFLEALHDHRAQQGL